jgi:hypothetical protein
VRSICADVNLMWLSASCRVGNEQALSAVEGGLLGAIRLLALGGAVLPSICRTGFLRKEMVYVTLYV